MKLRKISWEEVVNMVGKLANEIGSRNVDVVVGIGSSGLIPAVLLHKLLKTSEFYGIMVKLYDEGKPPKRLFPKPLILQELSPSRIRGKKILVVDDFASTGSTLRLVKEYLKLCGASKVITAVLVKMRKCTELVDYYAIESESCVIFPWNL